jgi:hypothetical protein
MLAARELDIDVLVKRAHIMHSLFFYAIPRGKFPSNVTTEFRDRVFLIDIFERKNTATVSRHFSSFCSAQKKGEERSMNELIKIFLNLFHFVQLYQIDIYEIL